MIADRRVDLSVEHTEREAALSLGARWDIERLTCFVEPGDDLAPFARWLLTGTPFLNGTVGAHPSVPQGIALSAFLGRVKHAILSGLPQAGWVRAEIRKIQAPASGHLYLELGERDGSGQPVAAAKGMIWKQRVPSIQSAFRAGTGNALMPDIKVLIRVRADFHPVYGFDLIIEDIDPAYTVGDLIAKLNAIRATLRAERVFAKNRQQKAPVEFVRVAVISPGTSAGLGDFRRDTDRLEQAGLCAFDYYRATFQGTSAPASIRECIRDAYEAHKLRPYDALVIIRGGGSLTDLAWLNDEMLARWVCRVPIPVFTGIGHERDSTILDEVAHQRFDTPSKVSQHITQTIRNNAEAARTAVDKIFALTARIVSRQHDALSAQLGRLEERVGYTLGKADSDTVNFFQQVFQNAGHVAAAASVLLERTRTNIECDAALQIRTAARDADDAHRLVIDQSQAQLRDRTDDTERAMWKLARDAESLLAVATSATDLRHVEVDRDARHQLTVAESNLQRQSDAVSSSIAAVLNEAQLRVDFYVQTIVGLGPTSTLNRGYAIARDSENRPIGSKANAVKQQTLRIQFRDGQLAVSNEEYQEGDSR